LTQDPRSRPVKTSSEAAPQTAPQKTDGSASRAAASSGPHFVGSGVSVVVPVLNGAATLFETLASITAQADGRRPIEIIVVDDGSRDQSRTIVNEAARHAPIRVLDGPRRGAAAAVNCGIRAARYPVIAQIDQDVALERDWLERVAACFADPRVGAVQGRYTSHRADGFFNRVMALDLEQRYDRLAEHVDHVCTGNTAYRAEALAAVGLLNEELGYGYDNDLSYRLGAAGYRLRFCRDARSRHRWREGLAGYLRQQYGFGYGRIDVVSAHPGRVSGDDVSPLAMMSHPVVAATALVCALTWVWSRWLGIAAAPIGWTALLLSLGLLVERAIAGVRAWRRSGDTAALTFPLVHSARDLAWVAAIAVWSARRLLRRASGPGASMAPRTVAE
jgi:cellulose synthase/poly-beta-1,6-N-acetylglucosamine synthase-like glycosyltransferase